MIHIQGQPSLAQSVHSLVEVRQYIRFFFLYWKRIKKDVINMKRTEFYCNLRPQKWEPGPGPIGP